MACKNCTMETYELRQQIANWLSSGYSTNQVASILTCNLSIVEDVQANGVGEAPVIEYETFEDESSVITAIKGSKSAEAMKEPKSSSIDE